MSGPDRHVPPEQRDLAMVFQDYALWPHLSALGNIGYALAPGIYGAGSVAGQGAGRPRAGGPVRPGRVRPHKSSPRRAAAGRQALAWKRSSPPIPAAAAVATSRSTWTLDTTTCRERLCFVEIAIPTLLVQWQRRPSASTHDQAEAFAPGGRHLACSTRPAGPCWPTWKTLHPPSRPRRSSPGSPVSAASWRSSTCPPRRVGADEISRRRRPDAGRAPGRLQARAPARRARWAKKVLVLNRSMPFGAGFCSPVPAEGVAVLEVVGIWAGSGLGSSSGNLAVGEVEGTVIDVALPGRRLRPRRRMPATAHSLRCSRCARGRAA